MRLPFCPTLRVVLLGSALAGCAPSGCGSERPGGTHEAEVQTAEQAPSRGLSDVCARTSDAAPIVLLDRSYVTGEGDRHRGLPLAEGGQYEKRLAVYDPSTGRRRFRLLIDRQDPNGASSPFATSCLGVEQGAVWLWTTWNGLHARSLEDGAVVVEAGAFEDSVGRLSSFGFDVASGRMLAKSASGNDLRLHLDGSTSAASSVSGAIERRTGPVDRPRVQRGVSPDDALATRPGWQAPEASACATWLDAYLARDVAPPGLVQASSPSLDLQAPPPCAQPTLEGDTVVYFGAHRMHGYASDSVVPAWSAEY